MYKGHKIKSHLKRYIGHAKTKYHRLRVKEQVDLWDVLKSYKDIASEPYCVQMYIYDLIKGTDVYSEAYEVINWVNGCVYVREVVEEIHGNPKSLCG